MSSNQMEIVVEGQKILYKKILRRREIQQRIGKMAIEIARDNQGKDELIMLGALNGVMPFLVDLSRRVGPLVKNLYTETANVSSYGNGTESNGNPTFILNKELNIEGKNVLFVDDLVDSGHSIRKAREELEKLNPATLKVAVLFSKPEGRLVEVPLDYVGFIIPKRYAMGMGLDDAGKGRWLQDLWARK